MTMRENHKEALFDFIRSKEHAGPALLVVFELFSGIKKIFWIVHRIQTTIFFFSMDSHKITR